MGGRHTTTTVGVERYRRRDLSIDVHIGRHFFTFPGVEKITSETRPRKNPLENSSEILCYLLNTVRLKRKYY